ncbi:MAG TPA: EAL domain-containing protein [Kineosporiaceae bacterium]|nr:EAL domain-containing protein [Kineosporiaceae bacterium]
MRWPERLRSRRAQIQTSGHDVSREQIETVLADPQRITMDFQPILDIRAARTAGWEVLARIDGRRGPAPDVWFAAAYALGVGLELEAATLKRAMAAMRMRVPGTFMSLNVTPEALADDQVEAIFAANAPLNGLVVELTEHAAPSREAAWQASCARLRDLGAVIAIDDLGTGYAELQQILTLKPQIFKIDRRIIDTLEEDPSRQALLRFLGLFSDQLDGWLVAEGVEQPAQLRVLEELGIPLAQGWFIGAPDAVPQPCRPEVTTGRPAPPPGASTADAAGSRSSHAGPMTVGRSMRPLDEARAWSPTSLRVPTDLPIDEAARRAMTRPADRRFEPLQCIDPGGVVVGELPVHDLVLALAGPGSDAPAQRPHHVRDT